MRAVIVVALLALLSIQCSEALRLRRRTRPGVPQDELNAAAAYFAADNYNPRVTSIPGWTHTLSYRFAMGSESQGQAGHADGFASDKYDFVIAFRGAVEEADEWSQKADSIDYDVIANPLDPEATSDSQVHERLYRSAQKYLSAKNTLDGKFTNQDFIDSMEKICLKGYKVTLTGHSQGGAVAAFVAWELRSKFSTCDLTLITFGAPPVMTETATQAFLKLTPAIDVRNYVTQCFDNGATVADPISQRFQRFHPLGTIRYLDGKDDRMEFPDQDKPKLAYPVAVLCHYPDNYFDALQDLLHLETDYWIRWCPRRRPRPIQGFQIVKEWSEVRQHHKRLMVSEQPENEGAAGRPKTLEDTFRANPCEHTPTFRLNTDYTPGARLPFPEPPKKVLAPGTA